jgi:hypothetical protein
MQAALAMIFLAPMLAGFVGAMWWAALWVQEHVQAWRDRDATPYIPTRVWWDDRYGGTDGDPLRRWSDREVPGVPPVFDPGPPSYVPSHSTYRR